MMRREFPLATTFVSATEVKVLLPAAASAAPGAVTVTAVTPALGGRISSTISLPVTYPVPAIASINPESVTAGAAALTLDIKGTGFTSASAVDWNGQALVSTLVSATEITASVPASGPVASEANLVTVVNPTPGLGASAATTFNVLSPTPVLSAVSPRNVTAGQQTSVTLTGSSRRSRKAPATSTMTSFPRSRGCPPGFGHLLRQSSRRVKALPRR